MLFSGGPLRQPLSDPACNRGVAARMAAREFYACAPAKLFDIPKGFATFAEVNFGLDRLRLGIKKLCLLLHPGCASLRTLTAWIGSALTKGFRCRSPRGLRY